MSDVPHDEYREQREKELEEAISKQPPVSQEEAYTQYHRKREEALEGAREDMKKIREMLDNGELDFDNLDLGGFYTYGALMEEADAKAYAELKKILEEKANK